MINVTFRAVGNPRTPDGKWESMIGCDSCGNVASAYFVMHIYQDHYRICRNIKLCKGCLCKGEDLIDKEILKQCSQRVE